MNYVLCVPVATKRVDTFTGEQ